MKSCDCAHEWSLAELLTDIGPSLTYQIKENTNTNVKLQILTVMIVILL